MTTNKTTEQEKAKTVYDSMVRKFGATSPHTADARDKYIDTVTLELAHREALAEDEKRTFCTDFQKKAAALRSPDLESAFAKEVGAFLDELTNKGE